MTVEGVLPVNKPSGMTSHDVVAKVRRILKTRKIGHTGTLDPDVTGVLPLCIGRATRIVEYLQQLPKEYVAVVRFGLSTDTEDMSGRILRRMDSVELTENKLRQAVLSFIGEIEQVPPMYSAVKVGGRRLYDLAREGVTVERPKRKAVILAIEILSMELNSPHPSMRFRVVCSKGTYIRTLCADMGECLQVPAVMAELVRTATGYTRLAQCHTLEEIETAEQRGEIGELLIPADQALSFLPALTVDETQSNSAMLGQPLHSPASGRTDWRDGELLRIYGSDSRTGDSRVFIGLFHYRAQTGMLKPAKIFRQPQGR